MIQTDKKRVTTENMPDYGKNGRRSLRYRQKNILERDWSKTKMTLRDANPNQWESREPDRPWISC